MKTIPTKKPFTTKNQKGQGLIEYLIIVAIMGVATIGIVRALGQTVSAKFASAAYAIQGKDKEARVETIDQNLYEKKDFSNFVNGAAKGQSNGQR